jgi:hypothetical protein
VAKSGRKLAAHSCGGSSGWSGFPFQPQIEAPSRRTLGERRAGVKDD